MAIRKRLRHWWLTRPIYWQCRMGWALTGHSKRKTLRYVGKQYRKKLIELYKSWTLEYNR